MGRPTVMTPEKIAKLEEAFMNSFTDEEACLYADIGASTLYDYCKDNPEFSERKERLKKKPNIKAKLNILRSLNNGDVKDSQWWLERKSRDEFSIKTEQKVSGEIKNLNVDTKDMDAQEAADFYKKMLKD